MAPLLPHFMQRSGYFASLIGLGLCLSFTFFFFWPHPPVSLLFLVLAAALAYMRLEIALALLPLTFPVFIVLQPLSPGGFPAFSLPELGMFICLGAALFRHVLRPNERHTTREWLGRLWRQAGVFLLPALVFLLGASLAVLVSPDRHTSLRAYREEVIEPLFYFLLILRYLRTSTDLARALGALLFSALAASVMGIVQGLFHLTPYLDSVNATSFRVDGPYTDPNNFAFLLDRTIPILLAVAFLGIWRRQDDGSASQRPAWREPLRWVCLLLLVPFVWGLYWTDSHGAEVALLLVVVFFLALELRSWLVAVVIGAVALLGVVAFWSRILQVLNKPGHGLVSERLILWKAGLLMIRDHFLLGVGPDNFNTLYRPSAPNSYLRQALDGEPAAGAPNPMLSHPHNFILDFWISTGLLGVIAVFWLLGAFAVVVTRTYRRCILLPRSSLLLRLLLGIAGSMMASVLHGAVDNMYFLPDLSLTFWFFFGMILALREIVQQKEAALRTPVKGEEEGVFVA